MGCTNLFMTEASLLSFFLVLQVELEVEMEKKENEEKTMFLQHLQDLGVDMTKYLLAIRKELVPTKDIIVGPPVKEIQLKTNTL